MTYDILTGYSVWYRSESSDELVKIPVKKEATSRNLTNLGEYHEANLLQTALYEGNFRCVETVERKLFEPSASRPQPTLHPLYVEHESCLLTFNIIFLL